ncbi:hypothetical protein HK096_002188 [Nowakowskiella sp. JEL0078]|nr:hypothetical protein HK096_002188 [Nowakowskiella sp. JEL0078]
MPQSTTHSDNMKVTQVNRDEKLIKFFSVLKNAVWQYQVTLEYNAGCYKDDLNGSHVLRRNLSPNVTLGPSECISHCAENKSSICGVGIQGNLCLGDTYLGEYWNKRGRVGDENCQMSCLLSEGPLQTSLLRCGGNINGEPTLSLYLVGIGNQSFTYTGSATSYGKYLNNDSKIYDYLGIFLE